MYPPHFAFSCDPAVHLTVYLEKPEVLLKPQRFYTRTPMLSLQGQIKQSFLVLVLFPLFLLTLLNLGSTLKMKRGDSDTMFCHFSLFPVP